MGILEIQKSLVFGHTDDIGHDEVFKKEVQAELAIFYHIKEPMNQEENCNWSP